MLDREECYPAGVPCWVDTVQPDPQAAVDFYGGVFGWQFEDRMPADGPGHYFVARLGGADVAAVGSAPEGAPPGAVWSTYVAVDGADDTVADVRDAGGTILADPSDVLDAGRMATFADPAGAVLSIWQAGQHKGAQVVNAPGSWNWSNLVTSDPVAAQAFYGQVFGWETRSVDMGGAAATMICRPGYVEVLEMNDPDIRRRQADAGAPDGFENAIAWMLPIDPDDVRGASPRWDVTFAVDDTDAVAARTAERGGTVLSEPVDQGPSRSAILADPQGAVFSVNSFNP
jgi:predicted enzyme related to lactoylglutathione lyase